MKIQTALSFDDVLMVDKFSNISSRAKVDTKVNFLGLDLTTAVISSNMACVTGSAMAKAMVTYGGLGALHRFWSVDENVAAFKESPAETIVSCGVGDTELARAIACYEAGATRIMFDVAQGGNYSVIESVRKLREVVKDNASIIVGNFSNANVLKTFLHKLPCKIDAVKVGIGGGSACITRLVTGCGLPTFASIIDCSSVGLPIIADGGIRSSGDFAKSLAAGATAVMCGRLFAACDESPAEIYTNTAGNYMKKYSGSASQESYVAQGKEAEHRTPEGETYWVKATGSAGLVVGEFNAGLRSAMGLNGALTITELQDNVEWVQVTANGARENVAHGKLDN